MAESTAPPRSETILNPRSCRISNPGHERAALGARMMRVGARYQQMADALEIITSISQLKGTRVTLEEYATSLISQRRLASRKKPALICWFCENCPDLLLNPGMQACLMG
jgi:hypothetical protein